jgi:hypothetical protein
MSTCAYTYAVARPFDPALLAGLRGVDGAPVRLVRPVGPVGPGGRGDVAAIVSPLAPDAASEDALHARLEDLTELEALARAHHAVVAMVAAHTVTVPFRLATVHHSEARVADLLLRRHDQLDALLDRFTGRVEIGVKVYATPDPGPSVEAPAATSTPGRDYLQRRRRATRGREQAWQRATALARRIDAELGDLAVDRRHHQPQDPRLSGAAGENVLNAAYLVDADRATTFTDRARRLAGTDVVVTGPWAPYSFTVADADANDDDEEPT